MRSIILAKPLDATTLEAIENLLDLNRDVIQAAWRQVQTNSEARRFQVQTSNQREIHLPTEVLRTIQNKILKQILYSGPVSPAAFAGVPGRSILMMGRRHLQEGRNLLSIDIEDAYGSTTYSHVSEALKQRLHHELWIFGLDRAEMKRVTSTLAYFLTVRKGGGPGRKLPMGAPSSVALFNLICLELDSDIWQQLSEFPKSYDVAYTRYVDDLVLSTKSRFRPDFEKALTKIINKQRYKINNEKTRRGPVETLTVCGLQRTAQGIEPSTEVQTRLARQIRHHRARVDSERVSRENQRQSLAVLRSIDGFLRQCYEKEGLERPEELRVEVLTRLDPDDADSMEILWP